MDNLYPPFDFSIFFNIGKALPKLFYSVKINYFFMVVDLLDIEIVELNESTKNLIDSFSCSFVELEKFLQEDALNQRKQCVNKTYFWVLKADGRLVAYLTVCVDAIIIGSAMRSKLSKKGINYKSLPALKIGRLAVNKDFTGKGIGRQLISFATRLAIKINNEASCRFLTVDSKNYSDSLGKNPVEFYKKMGFAKIKEGKNNSVPMYKDLISSIT